MPDRIDQRAGLLSESVDRTLVRRAVQPHIGDITVPGKQLLVEVIEAAERAARQEVALDVFDSAL